MTLTPTRSLVEKISAPSPPIAQDFTQAIGSVPIVRLNQVSPQCQLHNLYLKLESCNPGGSIKEKNAVYFNVKSRSGRSLSRNSL
jgi:cysteine synthase